MRIYGITLQELEDILARLNTVTYEGNLRLNDVKKCGRALQFTLRVKDSRGCGARSSARGRRTIAASWQAHRALFEGLFEINAQATIKTTLEWYKNREDFERKFAATWAHNVGSPVCPIAFGSL